jgi:hypothetical protein
MVVKKVRRKCLLKTTCAYLKVSNVKNRRNEEFYIDIFKYWGVNVGENVVQLSRYAIEHERGEHGEDDG